MTATPARVAVRRRTHKGVVLVSMAHTSLLARTVATVAAIAIAVQCASGAHAVADAPVHSPALVVGGPQPAAGSEEVTHSQHVRGSRRAASANDLTLGVEWTSYQGTKMSRWPMMVQSFGASVAVTMDVMHRVRAHTRVGGVVGHGNGAVV